MSTSKKKLVIAIDYGTTFSGLSFALTDAADFKDIHPWTKYPGSSAHHGEFNVKAPSRIAYAHENNELDEDAWGYQVESWMKSYSWTKLLLDDAALETEYDDPSLKHERSRGLMCLPKGKTAQVVVTDYLRGMFSMFESTMIEKFGKESWDAMPAEFWITVPATWSDRAKMRTMAAAQAAGFGARALDAVNVIPEPEAAAHAALKSTIHRVNDDIKPGRSILICDCGGGTVDITTYEILQVDPAIKLKELCVGIGGKCGGTFVDRNLHKLLSERFGAAFTSLDDSQTGPGSHFMGIFENLKKDFSSKDPRRRPARLLLPMPSLPAHRTDLFQYYDKRFSSVLLTHDDMRSLFDPVIDTVLNLLKDQVVKVHEDDKYATEDTIIVVVGGFGESAYLRERLAEWCENRPATMRTPLSGGWSAVVCGAVIRALEGSAISETMCRRHYGTSLSRPFLPGIHDSFNSSRRQLWNDAFSGKMYLSGFMNWEVKKGAIVDSSTEANLKYTHNANGHGWASRKNTLKLYCCGLDIAPPTMDGDGIEEVGTVVFSLAGLQVSHLKTIHKSNGDLATEVPLTLNIRMGDTAGVLRFRMLFEGKEVGNAELDISQ